MQNRHTKFLVMGIITFLLCCCYNYFAAPVILYSVLAMNSFKVNDIEMYTHRCNKARTWTILSFISVGVFYFFMILLFAAMVAVGV